MRADQGKILFDRYPDIIARILKIESGIIN